MPEESREEDIELKEKIAEDEDKIERILRMTGYFEVGRESVVGASA